MYYRLAQLLAVGIQSDDIRLRLYLNQDDYPNSLLQRLKAQNNNIKLIGFQMGASTLSRQWFMHKWQELAKLFLAKEQNYIILTGSPKERAMTQELKQRLNSDKVINMAGELGIRQAAALIGSLDVFITPDTGPLHIAAALKTPSVGLFVVGKASATNPIFDSDIHLFVQKDITCTPCVSKRCKYQKCMLQISAEEVYQKAVSLL